MEYSADVSMGNFIIDKITSAYIVDKDGKKTDITNWFNGLETLDTSDPVDCSGSERVIKFDRFKKATFGSKGVADD